MSSKKDLTIIIVSYNASFWLKNTLETLRDEYLKNTELDVETIVVDNNSDDDSVSLLKKSFRWVTLIESDANHGFAHANNLALKDVSSRYVMLLNSDTECTEQSKFDELVRYLDDHRKATIVTPKINLVNGSIDPASHRGEPTIWASFTYFAGLEKLFPNTRLFGQYHQGYQDLNTTHQIDACSAACMVIRTSAIKKVGLLDEAFFMYAEDLDWCRRFREAGYEIWYYPFVSVIHHKYKSGISNTSARIARKTRSYFYDTMRQYYLKYYATKHPKWLQKIVITSIKIKKELS